VLSVVKNGSYLFLTVKQQCTSYFVFFLAETFHGRSEVLVYIVTLLLSPLLITHTDMFLKETY